MRLNPARVPAVCHGSGVDPPGIADRRAIIYSLYREDVQESFDAELKKLVAAISVDSMGRRAHRWTNRFEPLFEVTYLAGTGRSNRSTVRARWLVSASLATSSLPSPLENNALRTARARAG
jgi:hypothetical protein